MKWYDLSTFDNPLSANSIKGKGTKTERERERDGERRRRKNEPPSNESHLSHLKLHVYLSQTTTTTFFYLSFLCLVIGSSLKKFESGL